MTPPHAKVRVELGARSYDVLIGQGLIAAAGERIAEVAATRRLFVVADETVGALHGAAFEASVRTVGFDTWTLLLPPGEAQKSFEGLERVCRFFLTSGADRSDLVVALGGGVIGDLAGLAAGLVKRGMDFVQVPTTLLAQVDSSVGGKTAIDTPEGKNLVGLFHQPKLVLADLDVLSTLPERQMRAGYAEVVKYGLIDLPDFYAWLDTQGDQVLARDPEALLEAVRVSVEAKARIVAADEREAGQRALLNLGHTFGHALETAAGYEGALLHGEAVAAGMALAYEFSVELGLCDRATSAAVSAHLQARGFNLAPSALPGAPHDADALIALMAGDKKAEAGRLTFVLARGIGQAFVQKNVAADRLRAFLSQRLR